MAAPFHTSTHQRRSAERQPSPRALRVVGAPRLAGARLRRRLVVAHGLIVVADALALVGAAFAVGKGMVNAAYVAVAALGLVCLGTYHLRCTLSMLDEAPRLAATLAVAALVCVPFGGSDNAVLAQAALSVPLLLVGRAIAYTIVRVWRRRGLREPTLIAGSGHVGIELASVITSHPEFGLDLVGFAGSPFPDLPAPLLGDIGQLGHVVTDSQIRRVIVAFGPTREADLVSVLRTAMLRAVQVHIVPRFFEVGVAPRGSDVDDLWGIPVYRVRQAALQRWAWQFKRCVDIVGASILLVLSLPVLAIAALIVKFASPGPILFRQRRIGQYGDEIEVLKFRTLPVEHVDDTWNADAEQYHNACWFLRRLSIDELPQLWNVLRGDMSLVGPRPERGYLVEQFNDEVYGYRDRHRLPVGLTGWAQVHGLRGETSLRERVRFDNHYIEHWSLWRDIVIMFRTVLAVFQRPAPGSRPDAQLPAHGQFGVGATPTAGEVELPAAGITDTQVNPVRSTVIR